MSPNLSKGTISMIKQQYHCMIRFLPSGSSTFMRKTRFGNIINLLLQQEFGISN